MQILKHSWLFCWSFPQPSKPIFVSSGLCWEKQEEIKPKKQVISNFKPFVRPHGAPTVRPQAGPALGKESSATFLSLLFLLASSPKPSSSLIRPGSSIWEVTSAERSMKGIKSKRVGRSTRTAAGEKACVLLPLPCLRFISTPTFTAPLFFFFFLSNEAVELNCPAHPWNIKVDWCLLLSGLSGTYSLRSSIAAPCDMAQHISQIFNFQSVSHSYRGINRCV